MIKRLRTLGVVLLVLGLAFVAGAGIAYLKVQDGYKSLDAFSSAQNVTLSYNEDGQLLDRGTTEGAEAIMTLLTDEWGFTPNMSDFNPDDAVVDTASEYMFQMATIGYHILHGTQTVTLAEDVEYNGETFAAGTYDVPVDGKYWTDFDRRHPLEGPARGQAWSGTAHGLFGELGVGTVTHSVLQIGVGVSVLLAGIGFTNMLLGAGFLWATKDETWSLKDSIAATEKADKIDA